MSGIINAKKSSFVVFGSGFDRVRDNSGDGKKPFLYKCNYSAFDVTNRYCWIVTKSGNPEDIRIRKLDTTTWEEVNHAFENVDVSGNAHGLLTYIENDNSNLGVLVTDQNETIIFDLTTDEVFCTTNQNLYDINLNYKPRATHVGDYIRIIGTTMNPNDYNASYAVINMADETIIRNYQSGGYTFSGFYNDTDIAPTNRYYGDRRYLWGGRIENNGMLTKLWGDPQAYYSGNVLLDSFSKFDDFYFPTKVGNEWKFGKYPIPPDLVTPSPSTTFGENANTLATPPVYTRGRTWASFRMTDNSLVVTDMVNMAVLYKGDSPSLTPIAMGDPWIICDGSDGYTYLARYK